MLRNIIVLDSSLVIIVGKVITIASSSKTILADYISLQCSRCSSKMSCLMKWFRHLWQKIHENPIPTTRSWPSNKMVFHQVIWDYMLCNFLVESYFSLHLISKRIYVDVLVKLFKSINSPETLETQYHRNSLVILFHHWRMFLCP